MKPINELQNKPSAPPIYHGLSDLYQDLIELLENSDYEEFSNRHFEALDHLLRGISDGLKKYREACYDFNSLANIPERKPYLAKQVEDYFKNLEKLIEDADNLRLVVDELIASDKELEELYEELKIRLYQFRFDIKKVDNMENKLLLDSWYQDVGAGD